MGSVLLLAGSASGLTLTTPLLFPTSSGCVECRPTNVSTAAIPVLIELVDSGGVVLNGFTCTTNPGTAMCAVGSCAPGVRAYCRFTFGASRRSIRAAGYLLVSGVAPLVISAE